MQPPLPGLEGDATSPSEDSKNLQFEPRPIRKPDLEKSDSISSHVQPGVENIEAAASVWTKWHLIAAYGM
jgi:hypothetical protein